MSKHHYKTICPECQLVFNPNLMTETSIDIFRVLNSKSELTPMAINRIAGIPKRSFEINIPKLLKWGMVNVRLEKHGHQQWHYYSLTNYGKNIAKEVLKNN